MTDSRTENQKDAVISDCGTYRYRLSRMTMSPFRGVRRVCWIMLNPSTADGVNDDPTIRRVLGFSESWGCTHVDVVNLYALRATDPKDLCAHADPIGPENDDWIRKTAEGAHLTVAAWGAHKTASGDRIQRVWNCAGHNLWCLGVTKRGAPRHPLYLPAQTRLERWMP